MKYLYFIGVRVASDGCDALCVVLLAELGLLDISLLDSALSRYSSSYVRSYLFLRLIKPHEFPIFERFQLTRSTCVQG